MSREYFLDDSESKYKDAYLKYMISIAQLLGANETHAVKEMNEVLDFEVQLANVSYLKVHSHVMSMFAFFFDLCLPILEKANVKCKHHHLLRQTPFLNFDVNANADFTCEQGFIHTKRLRLRKRHL